MRGKGRLINTSVACAIRSSVNEEFDNKSQL